MDYAFFSTAPSRRWEIVWTRTEAAAQTRSDVDFAFFSTALTAGGGKSCGQVVWTLTPIAAEGLRVHIVEYGLTGRSRWEGITFQPESISTRRRKNNSRVDDPIDDVVDPRPGPPEIAISDEESRRARPRGPWKVEHLPKPTLILMGCGLVWKERKKGSKKPCDVCKGLRLPTNAYCAKCSRWGLDAVVATRKSLARKNSRNKAS